jgi:hypothetical protein
VGKILRRDEMAKLSRKRVPQKRTRETARQATETGGVPSVSLTIIGKGIVEQKWVRGKLHIRVYTSHKAALEAGVSNSLADNVFRTSSGCAGGCSTQHDTEGASTFSYCEDIVCESQGDCACHLIRHYEDPPGSGKWKTEDLGKHYGKKRRVKEDGTSKYICDCYADSDVTV